MNEARFTPPPLYDADIRKEDRERALYDGVSRLVDELNIAAATAERKVLYAGSTSSGSADVPLGSGAHALLLAVIGDVPLLCAVHDGVIAGRGGNKSGTVTLTGRIIGETLTFEASGTLRALIALI